MAWGGDPCALLFGDFKTACENTGKLVSGGSSGGSSGSSGGSGSGPGLTGDLRHLMLRVAEVGIGIALVIIAGHSFLTGASPAKTARKVARGK